MRDSVPKIFLQPLDGSALRIVGEIPNLTSMASRLAPSADGKRVAFSTDGVFTSKIYEVDFGRLFK